MDKIILSQIEPKSSDSTALAQCIIQRIGLMPRKKGSTENMHRTFIEFYERTKKATAQKDPKLAVLTVDEMAIFAKISRQTMYEYLQRWLATGLIQKVSYIGSENKVTIGYKLAGNSLEESFSKMKTIVQKNLNRSEELISQLQKTLKNEKISASRKKNDE